MKRMRRYHQPSFNGLKLQHEHSPEAETFRELFENASDFIYATDLAGNFTLVNRSGERITGYMKNELIGTNIGQIVAPESLATVLRTIDHITKGLGAATHELDVIARDGRKVPLEAHTRLIYQDGRPAGLHGIARDVSLRLEADRKIQERTAHLEALNAVIAAADSAPELSQLLAVAIDRTLNILGLGMGGIWAGDHHVVRGVSPEIGTAVVEAVRGADAKTSAASAVIDWETTSCDRSNSVADKWLHIGVRASLTVPILAEGRCIGALVAASAYPRPWTRDEIGLAEAVAQQVAATAEGLRLFLETQERATLMGRLVAMSDSLNRPASLAGVAAAVGQAAQTLSGNRGGALYVRWPDGTFTCAWSKDVSRQQTTKVLSIGPVLPESHGMRSTLATPIGAFEDRTREPTQPALFPDILKLPLDHEIRRLAEQEGYRALGVWPIVYEERVIAAAWCYYEEPHTWSRSEQEIFQTFTRQAASALENGRLHETQAKRTFELEALYDMSSQLRATNTPEEIHSTLVEQAARLLQADYAALSLADSDGQMFVAAHTSGGTPKITEAIVPISHTNLDLVMQTSVPHVTGDVAGELQPDQLAALAAANCMLGPIVAVALRSEREVIGLITVGRTKGEDTRPFTQTEVRLLKGIAEMGGTAISRSRLHHNLEDAYIQMVLALARAVDAKDAYTGNHSQRLATLADGVAQAMDLPEEEVKDIRWGALLHDIGKIGAPDHILCKPGPLTDEEWAIMRKHPVIGEQILLPVARMRGVAKIIRHHQEKWDGTGYPDRLRNETIPLGARILAVVDAYSAIVDERPYKRPRTQTEAEAELKHCAGTHFDPTVVEVFIRVLNHGRRELRNAIPRQLEI